MTTRLTLDHLVYGVPNLADSMDEMSRRLGCAPHAGGRHEGLGTHNAILPLAGETYVELIAADPDAPSPNQPRPFGLDSLEGPRLITWAVRSRSIDADIDLARTRGFDAGVIMSMTRRSPSGEQLAWKLTFQTKPFGRGLVPFVIDWGETSHPATSGPSRPGDVVLDEFSAGHPDPESIEVALKALGVELRIDVQREPCLFASIRGPKGDFVLR